MDLTRVEPDFVKAVTPVIQAIQSCCCDDPDLLMCFLRDLWTNEEGVQFGKRWHIAQQLLEGKRPGEVVKDTQKIYGKTTHVLVERVSNYALHAQGCGGYREVYQCLNKTNQP